MNSVPISVACESPSGAKLTWPEKRTPLCTEGEPPRGRAEARGRRRCFGCAPRPAAGGGRGPPGGRVFRGAASKAAEAVGTAFEVSKQSVSAVTARLLPLRRRRRSVGARLLLPRPSPFPPPSPPSSPSPTAASRQSRRPAVLQTPGAPRTRTRRPPTRPASVLRVGAAADSSPAGQGRTRKGQGSLRVGGFPPGLGSPLGRFRRVFT